MKNALVYGFCAVIIIAACLSVSPTADAQTVSCPPNFICIPINPPTSPYPVPTTPTTTPSSCYFFTRNLTSGSTGADVAALQAWLISRGFDIEPITSGRFPAGQYGPATVQAVSRYQASVGLLGAETGFGPLTRASVNASCSPTPMPLPPVPPVPPSASSTLIVSLQSSPAGASFSKGRDADVASFNFRVTDSNVTLSSIAIDFNARLWLYASSISLRDDSGRIVAEKNGLSANDFTELAVGSRYRLRLQSNYFMAAPSSRTVTVRLASPPVNDRQSTTGSNRLAITGLEARAFNSAGLTTAYPATSVSSDIGVMNCSPATICRAFTYIAGDLTYEPPCPNGANNPPLCDANQPPAGSVSLYASLVSTSEDHAGAWYVFSPGVGYNNQNKADFGWNMMLTLSSPKTIKAITVTHPSANEAWSTASTDVFGKTPYPLVVMTSDGGQLNKAYNQPFTYNTSTPSYGNLTIPAGSYQFKLFGQIETQNFSGGQVRVDFSDGTSASAPIASSGTVLPQPVTPQYPSVPVTPASPALTPATGASVTASLVTASEDRAGAWYTFAPGRAYANPDPTDFRWTMQLSLSSPKTIKSISITHTSANEAWSTGFDNLLGRTPYPLVVTTPDYVQLNTAYDQPFTYNTNAPAYGNFAIPAGSYKFNLYGQIETPRFSGGEIKVVFTDRTFVTAPIVASSITPGGTSNCPGGLDCQTPTAATVSVGLDSASPLSRTVQLSSAATTDNVVLAVFDVLSKRQASTLRSLTLEVVTNGKGGLAPAELFIDLKLKAGNQIYSADYIPTTINNYKVTWRNLTIALPTDAYVPITIFGKVPQDVTGRLNGASAQITLNANSSTVVTESPSYVITPVANATLSSNVTQFVSTGGPIPQNPTPTISNVSPVSVAPGQQFTIYGSNFLQNVPGSINSSTVMFTRSGIGSDENASPQQVDISGTKLIVNAPTDLSGDYYVYVSNIVNGIRSNSNLGKISIAPQQPTYQTATLSPANFTKTITLGQSLQQVFVVENPAAGGSWDSWSFGKGDPAPGLNIQKYGAFSAQLSGTPTRTGTFGFSFEGYNATTRQYATGVAYITVQPSNGYTPSPTPTSQPTSVPSVYIAAPGNGATVTIGNTSFTGQARGGTGSYKYYWDFGDGGGSYSNFFEGSSQTIGHYFNVPGTFTTKLYVIDSAGATSNPSYITVTVTSQTSSGSVKVISPNGGESLPSDQPITITFTPVAGQRTYFNLSDANNAAFDLISYNSYYFRNISDAYYPISADPQTVSLYAPKEWVASHGSKYKIEICSGNACDSSDNYFTLTSANASPSPSPSSSPYPYYQSSNQEQSLSAAIWDAVRQYLGAFGQQ